MKINETVVEDERHWLVQRRLTLREVLDYARSPGYVRSYAGWKAAARDLWDAIPTWVKLLDAVPVAILLVLKVMS